MPTDLLEQLFAYMTLNREQEEINKMGDHIRCYMNNQVPGDMARALMDVFKVHPKLAWAYQFAVECEQKKACAEVAAKKYLAIKEALK